MCYQFALSLVTVFPNNPVSTNTLLPMVHRTFYGPYLALVTKKLTFNPVVSCIISCFTCVNITFPKEKLCQISPFPSFSFLPFLLLFILVYY